MVTFNGNPYYNPERCGLVILQTLEADLSYEFEIFVLWKDIETGNAYFGYDSGCSCPTPFEDFTSLYDMTQVTWGSLNAIHYMLERCSHISLEDVQDMMRAARSTLLAP
jgi:hypothetical protein